MAQETLLKIGGIKSQGSKGLRTTFWQKMAKGPVADKFFVAGSIFGLIGTIVVGVSLWLMRNGAIGVSPSYIVLREVHVKVQLFLLFGLFILGFLLQASPRVLGCKGQSRGIVVLLVGALPFVALALGHGEFLKEVSKYVLATPFLIALISLYFHRNPETKMGPEWLFVTLSLLGFGAASFLKNSDPSIGLFSFIATIGSVLIGFAPAFIANLLGGERLKTKDAQILFGLLLITLVSLRVGSIIESSSLFRVSAASGLLVTILLIFKTRLLLVGGGILENPLVFGFRTGFLWAIVGFLLAAVLGPTFTDYLLHILATGWALPVLFLVSLQIMGFLSGEPHLPKKTVLIPLILWQTVPLLRCIAPVSGYGGNAAWFVVIGGSVMFAVWIKLLFSYERKILLRQFQLNADEEMVTEG